MQNPKQGEVMAREEALPAQHPTDCLVGQAPAIQALRGQIRRLAAFDAVGNPYAPTVLLQGETGTGKGLVARIIHDRGPRAQGPFLDVNCAAIPATLLEAELFGFEAGAFTDAKRAKPGLFEAASGGTLFLDEIEALPPALQSKLLTAIEAKRIRRLGAVLVDAQASDTAGHVLPVGETFTLPVRLLGFAAPGEILLSAYAGRLVEGWYEFQRREVQPTGGEESIAVYALLRLGAQPSPLERMGQRALSRFVGRDRELAALREILAQAQGGRGQVVGIVGEPGVGKSRLLYEFRRRLAAEQILSMEAHCSSYGTAVPYRPLLDLVKAYFQLEDGQGGQPIRDKIASRLLSLDEALRPALPVFLTLLDVPVDDPLWQTLAPLPRRQRSLDALTHLLLRESQAQPLLLVFENLHWIDAETQAFLDGLVESLAAARLLLLVTYRPEYRHGWGQKTYYTQPRLDPLPPAGADEFLQALLGAEVGARRAVPLQPLMRLLIARTQGHPFFLEESVQSLVETQVLASSRAAVALAQQLAQPSSLAHALYWAAVLHHLRREAALTQARTEAVSAVATEWEIPVQVAHAKPLRGWALTARGHGEEGRAQIQQALAGERPTRWSRDSPYHLALLAEASAQVGQPAAGLEALGEALAAPGPAWSSR
jgi:hypothetical protein